MKNNKKFGRIALVVALLVVVCVASIAGTVAWLQDSTKTITNTFTHSNITVSISETGAESEGDNLKNSYQMVPGSTITKDPKVKVEKGSEKCYLFVKLEKSDNYSTYLEDYIIADGWNILNVAGAPGVYYRVVDATSSEAVEYHVLKDDQLEVKEEVTKLLMEAIATIDQPTLKVTGYAVQFENMDSAHTAWKQIVPAYVIPTNP